MPVACLQFVLLLEDKRFWTHPGVDPVAVSRAGVMMLRRAGRLQGGSGIPEQLAKLAGTDRSRTARGRLARAGGGLALVRASERETLLHRYVRSVYVGRGARGLFAGAVRYFGKRLPELRPAEAFFLAERIALPERFRPTRVQCILRRKAVREVLGADVRGLPDIYGQAFGPDARRELAKTLVAVGA